VAANGCRRRWQAVGPRSAPPVFNEAEAKRRAEAILNDHAKKFLTGEADGIGLPSLCPDRNITMSNLGEPFSKTYCIQQTTHTIDTNGYRRE
jgi:Bacteriophage probable baseplate hub protein